MKNALPYTDILVLNEIEMQQLVQALGVDPSHLGVETVVITRGARGARIMARKNDWAPVDIAAPQVNAIDTTGAGDTFTGYMVAGLDAGLPLDKSVRKAVAAAALKVTRKGTADAIPSSSEVEEFLG